MNAHLNLHDILISAIVIIISLTIHEMMHAFVGHRLGDETAAEAGRISLNPLKHIDPLMTVVLPVVTLILFGFPMLAAKPVPFDQRNLKWDEFGSAIIAAAGPLSNLFLAVIGALALHLNAVYSSGLVVDFIGAFISINVSLFVFNMIPLPPLDGSRVLYAFAPDGLRRVMEQIEPYGLFIVLIIAVGGGFSFLTTLIRMVIHLLPIPTM